MLDEGVIQRVLGTALRTGGDFAEVFVEDKRASSAALDDGRVEELGSAATGAPASGSSPATPPATPIRPTSPRRAAQGRRRGRRRGRGGRWR